MVFTLNKTIQTPHGPGCVVAFEEFRTCSRVGVKLVKNPFSFPVAFYFTDELKKLNETPNISLND